MSELHGGDITGYRLKYGREPLDFSASLNPLGMPQAVKQVAKDAVEAACPYPDPHARELTTTLAEKLGAEAEHIIWGNGSADLIYRYVQAMKPRRALLPAPSFAEYERALRVVNCDVKRHALQAENSFDLDESILPKITRDVDVLFLCQPNNPTGRLIAPALLDEILRTCKATGTRLFLDECFVSFVAEAKRVSKLSRLAGYPGLFILGSFTKLYGMAGLRLGYGLCSDVPVLERMVLCGQPWAVSTVVQAAGVAALAQDDYVRESLALIETEKAWLSAELSKLGIAAIGGAANYLFFAAPDEALCEKLARQGILIRNCANFRGLQPCYYRIAVRTRKENAQLIAAIHDILNREG